ncbi:9351_t:CDS:2 [Funneliformis geosporum]|uniref:9351_t:CDS:1 n=1 Tax=Funneliformis geosporum TaxID=1117311 RepID=A0A9W4SMS2_9GLOM|nr:9351_t:CDS:2 [Funneliformis geosporum]
MTIEVDNSHPGIGQRINLTLQNVIALKNAFDKIYQKDPLKLTFMIAQKRHYNRYEKVDSYF